MIDYLHSRGLCAGRQRRWWHWNYGLFGRFACVRFWASDHLGSFGKTCPGDKVWCSDPKKQMLSPREQRRGGMPEILNAGLDRLSPAPGYAARFKSRLEAGRKGQGLWLGISSSNLILV